MVVLTYTKNVSIGFRYTTLGVNHMVFDRDFNIFVCNVNKSECHCHGKLDYQKHEENEAMHLSFHFRILLQYKDDSYKNLSLLVHVLSIVCLENAIIGCSEKKNCINDLIAYSVL